MRAAISHFPITTAADFSETVANRTHHNMFHYSELDIKILINTRE
jgi:hypothetical protein